MEGVSMKGKYENELSLIGNDENEKTPEGSDSNVIQQKNSYYWDTKGNEFLKAIVLPYYGAFISEENYQLFGDISEKNYWRSAVATVNLCNIMQNVMHLNYGLWIYRKDR